MRWVMLDKIEILEVGVRAHGVKAVCESEDYFEHHFPDLPAVPGAIMIEVMAQLAGRLLMLTVEEQEERRVWAWVAGVESVQFFNWVRPGELMRVRADLVEWDAKSASVECEIQVNEVCCAVGTLDMSLTELDARDPVDVKTVARIDDDHRRLLEKAIVK